MSEIKNCCCCTLPSVRVYAQQFFMASFSLTSLNVVVFRHDAYTQSVQYTAGQRTICKP